MQTEFTNNKHTQFVVIGKITLQLHYLLLFPALIHSPLPLTLFSQIIFGSGSVHLHGIHL